MTSFTFGHASGADWQAAARACIDRLQPQPPGSNLGFLYVTSPFAAHMADILAFMKSRTLVEDWVGTVGLGICSTAVEYFTQPAVAVLVGRFPEDSFRVFSSIESDFDQFERQHRPWLDSSQPYFGVVHGDPGNGDIVTLVEGLSERMNGGFLVGGLSSSQGDFPQIAGGVTQGGLSGVLFSSKVTVSTRLTQGCAPIGARHVVTRAQGNVLIELDDRRAIDVLKDDIGDVLARNLDRIQGYIFAGVTVSGSDTGDYLVRNLIGVDPDNGLVAIGDTVEVGRQVMFCRRDAQTAEQDLERMLGEIKRSLPGEPKGGVYYSCLARGPNLFGSNSEELRIIHRELGSFPLVGFFANGEVSHNRLYTYTGVLTLFS